MIANLNDIRKIIEDNPELPTVFLAAESIHESPRGMPFLTFPSIGEIYDGNDAPDKNKVYTDREELERDVRELLKQRSEFSCLKSEEFDIAIKRKMKEHEPFWKKCVLIYIKPARGRRSGDGADPLRRTPSEREY